MLFFAFNFLNDVVVLEENVVGGAGDVAVISVMEDVNIVSVG